MRKVTSFFKWARFQLAVIKWGNIFGILLIVWLIALSIFLMTLRTLGAKNLLYFLTVVLTLCIAMSTLAIMLIRLTARARRKSLNRKTAVFQPRENRIEYDDDDDRFDAESGEVSSIDDDGYKLDVRQVANPAKKKTIYSGGLGYKPIEELDLPRPAINFLLTVARDRDPDSPANSNTTPEQ